MYPLRLAAIAAVAPLSSALRSRSLTEPEGTFTLRQYRGLFCASGGVGKNSQYGAMTLILDQMTMMTTLRGDKVCNKLRKDGSNYTVDSCPAQGGSCPPTCDGCPQDFVKNFELDTCFEGWLLSEGGPPEDCSGERKFCRNLNQVDLGLSRWCDKWHDKVTEKEVTGYGGDEAGGKPGSPPSMGISGVDDGGADKGPEGDGEVSVSNVGPTPPAPKADEGPTPPPAKVDEWGGDEWGDAEETDYTGVLVAEHATCGARGQLLSKDVPDMRSCAALAEGAGAKAFSLGTGYARGRCYAETLDVDESLIASWEANRADPPCPEGGWQDDALYDFYYVAEDAEAFFFMSEPLVAPHGKSTVI